MTSDLSLTPRVGPTLALGIFSEDVRPKLSYADVVIFERAKGRVKAFFSSRGGELVRGDFDMVGGLGMCPLRAARRNHVRR